MTKRAAALPALHPYDLTSLFFEDTSQFGDVWPVELPDVPADAQALLVHHQHMTDAMEHFHGTPVQLAVVAIRCQAESYARISLLVRQSDQGIVQLGIVRLKLDQMPEAVRGEIQRAQTPLGRILRDHKVMRSVQFERLWELSLCDGVRELVRARPTDRLFGRTARILVRGSPTIELLEIVVMPPDGR